MSPTQDPAPPSLRSRQSAATRALILDAAYQILTGETHDVISHELVASRCGASPRTVYRHFPTQGDLYNAMWDERLREKIPPGFPMSAEEIPARAVDAFMRFETHEEAIRAIINSPAASKVRNRGGIEGRAAFEAALAPVTAHLDAEQRRLVVAVFVGVFSSPFWQVLRDRAQLNGPDAQRAVHWAMRALLATLTTQPGVTP